LIENRPSTNGSRAQIKFKTENSKLLRVLFGERVQGGILASPQLPAESRKIGGLLV
jgi:hypothetical protein